jgi:hypothetical protein
MFTMSEAVIGEADVTSPLPFTVNFRGVMVLYGFALTFCKSILMLLPVNPDPTTSPINVSGSGGIVTGTGVMFVTKPFAFTVTIGIVFPLPNVPEAKFTVASVIAATPGPEAVASPESPVI